MNDTIQVRKGEEINTVKLEVFLRNHISELPDGELQVAQFGSGHSNLTYHLQIGGFEAVLRRPPLGPVAEKAHNMRREFTILRAIHPRFSLAPKVYLFSDDLSIVGSPFFVMERKHGVVLDTAFPKSINGTPDVCRRLSEIMVDKLVHLHEIPYQETDLVHMTKPEGFMERQVTGWITRYERAKTDDFSELELLTRWLMDFRPDEADHTVIHYDYKFNNAMFSNDLTKMIGLFDWEMTTVGNPLSDLGVAMGYWFQPGDKELLNAWIGAPPITIMPGFMTRREFVEAYAKRSGRDVSDIHFYLTFAYFKLAVIVQQIYYRFKAGQTQDARFARMGDVVKSLIRYALATANQRTKGI